MGNRLRVTKLTDGHWSIRGKWIITEGALLVGAYYTTQEGAFKDAIRLATRPKGIRCPQ